MPHCPFPDGSGSGKVGHCSTNSSVEFTLNTFDFDKNWLKPQGNGLVIPTGVFGVKFREVLMTYRI